MIKLNLQLFGGRGSGGGKGGRGNSNSTDPVIRAMKADSAEERAYALKDALKANGGSESDGWYVRDNIVYKSEEIVGKYASEAQIDTSEKGYFKFKFVHYDGNVYSDTYDSTSEVISKAKIFFRMEREQQTLFELRRSRNLGKN